MTTLYRSIELPYRFNYVRPFCWKVWRQIKTRKSNKDRQYKSKGHNYLISNGLLVMEIIWPLKCLSFELRLLIYPFGIFNLFLI